MKIIIHEIDDLLDWLNKLKDSGNAIIVEGKKDKAALEKQNIFNVFALNRDLNNFCEEFSKKNKDAIILTDLDKEGKMLYSRIRENLEKNHVKIDDSFRNFLFKETGLRQIEGLNSYMDKLFSKLDNGNYAKNNNNKHKQP